MPAAETGPARPIPLPRTAHHGPIPAQRTARRRPGHAPCGPHDRTTAELHAVHDRFSVQVRRETAAEHARVERILRLPDRLAGPGDLLDVLGLWQRIWSDVAPATGTRPGRDSLEDLASRALDRLAVDREALARLAGRRPPRRSVPEAGSAAGTLSGLRRNEAGCWGVGYVLRGTLVGGRVLAPEVVRRLALPAGVGVTYLDADGEDVGAMWTDFRRRLDSWALAASAWQRQECLATAVATFRVVQGWALELSGEPVPPVESVAVWMPS